MTTNKRWTREDVLGEARRRVAAMVDQTPENIKSMLESLVRESGWEGEEFLSSLCKDVVRRSSMIPPPRTSVTMERVVVPQQKKVVGISRK